VEQTRKADPWSLTRRQFIKVGGLGAAAAFLPTVDVSAAAAQADGGTQAELIRRPIPGTDRLVPAIGLGTFMTFDSLPGEERSDIREVVRRFWQAGGRLVDTSALYGMAEVNLGQAVTSLGLDDELLVADKIWSTGEYLFDDSHAAHSLERSMERLARPIDLLQCHSLVNVDVVVPLLQAWKREGRIRYLGVTHHEPSYFVPLVEWIERGAVDFVQVHYSIHTRQAEERVLRAAADRGVAVLVNMPLEKGRLHQIVEGRPLPDFAAELGIETWSQYFLKWVIANPVVTAALPATSNPDHLLENVGAMRGPLPDPEMRARMVRHMESTPGFDRLAEMAWYPGKSYAGLVASAQASVLRRRSA
jgi:diketogulonate reductase-like aldo/keto reductase